MKEGRKQRLPLGDAFKEPRKRVPAMGIFKRAKLEKN